MNTKGFRQTNAWLHTWSGLLLGWLLFAIFATGTLSFFRDEISFWMQPEQHGSVANESTPERVMAAMQAMAPDASLWSISLPGPISFTGFILNFTACREYWRDGWWVLPP